MEMCEILLMWNTVHSILVDNFSSPTIDNDAGLAGVGWTKVVGDDALVTALVCESDMPQVKNRGVLHHTSTHPWCIGCCTLLVCTHVGIILYLSVPKQLLVLTPRKGHGGGAAARSRTGQFHVTTEDGDCGFWLHSDLGLRKVIYR